MTTKFKYSLDRSSKKFPCPQCGKKTFVQYIETETGYYISDSLGRCDRETNCGFHSAPQKEVNPSFEYRAPVEVKTSFHPIELLNNMFAESPQSDNLTTFLQGMFPLEKLFTVMQSYFLTGTSKPWINSTVFWQIDDQERIRAGKVMLYNRETGKRVKEPFNKIGWVHQGNKEFNLSQCLFGLHRVNEAPEKPLGIVESEKTAIILSIFKPEYIWLATGAKGNFKLEFLKAIKKHRISAFPDKGEYVAWSERAAELNNRGFKISVSNWLEQTDQPIGTDLADMYILSMQKDQKKQR